MKESSSREIRKYEENILNFDICGQWWRASRHTLCTRQAKKLKEQNPCITWVPGIPNVKIKISHFNTPCVPKDYWQSNQTLRSRYNRGSSVIYSCVISFLHFLIHTAWWWLLCAAETCSCNWISCNKCCVSTDNVPIIAYYANTMGCHTLRHVFNPSLIIAFVCTVSQEHSKYIPTKLSLLFTKRSFVL